MNTMRSSAAAFVLLAQVVFLAEGASFCDDGEFATLWSDEFDGPELNETVWTALSGSEYNSYCRSAYCDASNVHLEDGKLVLTSLRNSTYPGFEFTTGVVTSKDKHFFNATSDEGAYRICVSAMLPGWARSPNGESKGYWPAHWMMPNDNSCWPDHGEMDILEMINGDAQARTTYHWSDAYPNKTCTYQDSSVGNSTGLPSDWNSTYHEFSVERGMDYLVFAVDGIVTINTSSGFGYNPPSSPVGFAHTPFYMLLQTAIGGDWPGNATENTVFPGYHRIDW
eukprot:gene17968-27662_t